MRLQKNYHLRQKELVRIKKLQYEKYKKAIEYHRAKNEDNKTSDFDNTQINPKVEESNQLQIAIYRTMEEADSLLEILNRRESESDTVLKPESKPNSVDSACPPSNLIGTKKPKDENIVIEELRTLNHQLHILVYQLVTQLDESLHETETLRDRVRQLENKSDGDNDSKFVPKKHDSEIQISTDITENYVYHSSSDDVSPDAIEAQELLVLPPLELPSFDLNTLILKTESSSPNSIDSKVDDEN